MNKKNCIETTGMGIKIRGLSNLIKRRLDRKAATMLPDEFKNTTGTQGMFIGYILCYEPGPVFQKDIEAKFNIRRPTATKILQLMEQNGLIKKESVPNDARLKKLIPTEKGRLFNDLLWKNIIDTENTIKENISPEDLAIFCRVLDQMIENVQKD